MDITYHESKRFGMYVAIDGNGKVCGYVSRQTIEDRHETHLIVNK